MGTHWELERNMLGTKKKRKKKPPSPPLPKLIRKKIKALLMHANLPIGSMKFVFPKQFVTIFGLG
jgi:hypothetical protein